LIGLASILPQAALSGDPEPDAYRAIKVYRGATVASTGCHSDVCSTQLPPVFMTSIPSGMGTVDVTAQLTIEYTTTRGDSPAIRMRMGRATLPRAGMAPGPLQLRAGSRTTTTLVWARLGVTPDTYHFRWAFDPGETPIPFRFRATEAVLVVEATPST
jgi:hypothetical protein